MRGGGHAGMMRLAARQRNARQWRSISRTAINGNTDRETIMRTGYFSIAVAVVAFTSLANGLCFASGSMETPQAVQMDADYAAGKRAIDNKDWNAAIKSLSVAADHDPKNADIQNYLGYANRKLGQTDLAFKYYERALQLDPTHRGAHEYIGETYLMVNNLPKAEEHLSALKKICFMKCEEYGDLKVAIAEYRKSHPQ
jgi:Flp pilus assembly protein TadD